MRAHNWTLASWNLHHMYWGTQALAQMCITRYAQSRRFSVGVVGLLWPVYQGARNLAECFYCINWFPIRFGNKLVLPALGLWIILDDIPHKNEYLHTMGFGIKNWSQQVIRGLLSFHHFAKLWVFGWDMQVFNSRSFINIDDGTHIHQCCLEKACDVSGLDSWESMWDIYLYSI